MRTHESQILPVFLCGEIAPIWPAPVEHVRYTELVRRFVEHKNSLGLQPKTIHNYITLLNHFGVFLKGDVYVEQITLQTVEKFISERRGSRPATTMCKSELHAGELQQVAPKTIRNEVFTLVDLFHWAKERNFIANDPTHKLKKPRRVVYDAPRHLSVDEYVKLKAAIKNPKFGDIVDFYLLTGIRREDGKRVTSENFDFESMLVTLPQHKQALQRRCRLVVTCTL